MKKISAIVAATAALSMLGSTGCIVQPARPVYVQQQPAYVEEPNGAVYATEAPPPPQVEEVGVASSPDVIWVGGFWVWGGGHWVWNHGYWGHPPHPGAHWHADEWHQGPHGWERHAGHWE